MIGVILSTSTTALPCPALPCPALPCPAPLRPALLSEPKYETREY